ncbi:MAG: SufE family protein [Deltaproteobacteria bacterium]|nr:MAG: SufE family protein [Deltaproteobacteria bacterium]TNF24453.1 MAG: SufE family protein [Deltaproteobacteria bacterium]
MEIQERVKNLVEEFARFNDWEERYKHIIAIGKDLEPMKEEYRQDQFKIKGCQSQVWLYPELNGDKIMFHADSDASIVKGVIALLMRVYSNATPAEILATKPDFLDTIGLREQLSMSRANGLSSMLKQISMYAVAFQAKMNMG